MIKAIVFDMDDTLISEINYIESGFKIIAEKISKSTEVDSRYILKLLLDEFNVDNRNVFNRVVDRLGIIYEEDYILNLIRIYRNHMSQIDFLEDAKECIKYLRLHNYKLDIITDGYKETQLNKIEVLNCKSDFDYIIVTDELGREFWKPHEKAYLIMIDKLGIKYNECIYIGDNINKDFITANRLGIHTIGINREYGIYSNESGLAEEYMPKYKVTNLDEIKNIINQLNNISIIDN